MLLLTEEGFIFFLASMLAEEGFSLVVSREAEAGHWAAWRVGARVAPGAPWLTPRSGCRRAPQKSY